MAEGEQVEAASFVHNYLITPSTPQLCWLREEQRCEILTLLPTSCSYYYKYQVLRQSPLYVAPAQTLSPLFPSLWYGLHLIKVTIFGWNQC